MQSMHSTVSVDEHRRIDLDELCRSQKERLGRFILKKIWNKQDAEDILQMTFLEALRSKDRYAGASKPETWLFGIAANLVRNYFKRRYAQVQLDEMTDELLDTLQWSVVNDPGVIVEHELALDRTAEAIDLLPEDVKSIFHLIANSDCSYQEAASHIGVPVGTIRSRLSRARKSLKSYLGM